MSHQCLTPSEHQIGDQVHVTGRITAVEFREDGPPLYRIELASHPREGDESGMAASTIWYGVDERNISKP